MSMPPTKAKHDEHVAKDGGFSAQYYQVKLFDYSTKPPTRVGNAELEFCAVCGLVVVARCEHTKCTWNRSKTELRCDACNADCT